jgi:hypothetical protein
MYELITKCVGEKDPVCLFSAIFGNVLGWEDISSVPFDKVKKNLASSFDSSCIPVGLI